MCFFVHSGDGVSGNYRTQTVSQVSRSRRRGLGVRRGIIISGSAPLSFCECQNVYLSAFCGKVYVLGKRLSDVRPAGAARVYPRGGPAGRREGLHEKTSRRVRNDTESGSCAEGRM